MRFTKMHGLGNDFVVCDATAAPLRLSTAQMRQLANRRLGVGCDQILAVETAQRADADFFYRIYNADGSESGQCGNGARCLARFIREQGLSSANRIVVETLNGLMVLEWLDDEQIRVQMGVPAFAPAAIPIDFEQRQNHYDVALSYGDHNEVVPVQALSVGNPHAVVSVTDVASAPVASWGPLLEAHSLFPQRVNVGFMQVVDASRIKLRVFERGAGETRACGSGACAAVVAGRLNNKLADRVQVELPGGILSVEWQGEGEPVYLIGTATTVFTGQMDFKTDL